MTIAIKIVGMALGAGGRLAYAIWLCMQLSAMTVDIMLDYDVNGVDIVINGLSLERDPCFQAW